MVKLIDLQIAANEAGDDTPMVIGWDGIAIAGTEHLEEVQMEKRDMTKAFLMDAGCKLIKARAKLAKVAVIATNQTRVKVGSMDSATHTPGGAAWPFISSQRLEIAFDGGSAGSLIKDDKSGRAVGRWVRGKLVKNTIASPMGLFSVAQYFDDTFPHPLYDGVIRKGIDNMQSLFESYKEEYIVNVVRDPNNVIAPKREPIVFQSGKGWWVIHPKIDPAQKPFRESDWPAIVKQIPMLLEIPYGKKL
jgi:hypothetical protein